MHTNTTQTQKPPDTRTKCAELKRLRLSRRRTGCLWTKQTRRSGEQRSDQHFWRTANSSPPSFHTPLLDEGESNSSGSLLYIKNVNRRNGSHTPGFKPQGIFTGEP